MDYSVYLMQPCELGTLAGSAVQMSEATQRQVKQPTQGHTAGDTNCV